MTHLHHMQMAHARLKDAATAYDKAIAETLHHGRLVAWKHGDKWRHGTVLRTVGDRVLIASTAGKEYWLYAYRIER